MRLGKGSPCASNIAFITLWDKPSDVRVAIHSASSNSVSRVDLARGCPARIAIANRQVNNESCSKSLSSSGARCVTAMSSSPLRKRARVSTTESSWMRSFTKGIISRNLSTASGRIVSAIVESVPTETLPTGRFLTCSIVSLTRRMSARSCSARGNRASPASVSSMPRFVRVTSSTSRELSSSRIVCVTAGCVSPSCRAAARRLPNLAAYTNASNCCCFTACSMPNCRRTHEVKDGKTGSIRIRERSASTGNYR
ncbi:hypothetical protein AWB71_05642 [Caballeronia peredens]|nr:hypothetical protein AWB71_05642 [Caballeronia peredens]